MWLKIKDQIKQRSLVNVIAVLIIGYMAFSTLGVISRNYRLQQEVDSLQNQISLLAVQTQTLTYQIAYYQTDAFADLEARDKLGLMAPGEHVVIFPNKVPTDAILNPNPAAGHPVKQALSNLQQWLYFLFNKTPSST